MEDFFRQFRTNLEQRPEPGFEEQDWQALQKRLDQADKKRPLPLVWWWLGLPLLLLTGSNAWFYRALQQANRQIATLEIRRDTILQTQVVHMTDPIYRTHVVRERIVEYLPAVFANRSEPASGRPTDRSGEPHPAAAAAEQNRAVSLSLGGTETSSKPADNASRNQNTLDNEPVTSTLDPLLFPNRYLTHAPTFTLEEVPTPVIKRKKTFRQQLYTLRPKGFQMGITGGWAYPISQDLHRQRGSSMGLQAAVEFSPSLQLWLDALYFNVRFETDRMDPSIGVPVVPPPTDNFTFIKAELPQPSFQYALGMQHLFFPGRPLRPLIGLGYGVVSLLPYEISYDFEDQALGIEFIFEKQVPRTGLLTDFGLLRIGADYQLSRHWNAQLRATYRSNLEATGLQSPKMLGLQGGLNYRF